jgi:hypothetical protein
VSNNPYKSTPPEWAYTDKNRGQRNREWEPREDNRVRCRVCDVPMVRAWFYVNVDGPQADKTENKLANDDFCSVRCLRRRLYGLPDDDEKAMDALLHRAEVAEAEAKDAQALADAHVSHLETIRGALASLLEVAPGLARGGVPPPGQVLARHVAALQKLVAQRVYADPDAARRRLPRQHP